MGSFAADFSPRLRICTFNVCWFLQGADIWELKNSDPGLAIGKIKEWCYQLSEWCYQNFLHAQQTKSTVQVSPLT